MDNIIVWAIIIGFYAPLHYLPPILMILFYTPAETRKPGLIKAVLDCTVSMVAAFVLVYLVGLDNIMLPMMILLAALFMPYIRVIKVVLKNRSLQQQS